MKVLACFDSFKESMSAKSAGEEVQRALDDDVEIIPLADGGEGTLEALSDGLKGTYYHVEVTSPNFKRVIARYMIADDLAVIECAQACGLDLLEEEEKNALYTTSLGVGEMIVDAFHHGARRFMITLGGSATNDGGIGMLTALGICFLDGHHQPVSPNAQGLGEIVSIDRSHYLFQNEDVSFIAACDVENPLLGPHGATYVFGPQKGLQEERLECVDQAMAHYALLSEEALGKCYREIPGTGAAGGLGYAIVSYLGGRLEKGFEIVSQMVHLDEAIKKADVVVTGEGSIDQQTLSGKTPYGVLMHAKRYHKPVVVFAGKVKDVALLKEAGFMDVICINEEIKDLATMLKEGPMHLERAVRRYFDENC
ncbi:glycerate kinase [Sharpea azabuensis]|uniref:glycerate kinase n=1 Tax=Sharpea azabuensis TaxID=322505 RepID=UPI002E803939|nr:glycerate kinase [Sharpea azabuensis]MEE3308383.1 glycerate kinase [Sharpea azabuensis]